MLFIIVIIIIIIIIIIIPRGGSVVLHLGNYPEHIGNTVFHSSPSHASCVNYFIDIVFTLISPFFVRKYKNLDKVAKTLHNVIVLILFKQKFKDFSRTTAKI